MPTVTAAEEVLEKIQEGLNTWEGPVRASGGALSNDKSCWWYIDFSFDHKKIEKLEGKLTAIDIDGTQKALKRLDVNESFETLGVQLNPMGNDDAVFADMKQWAKDWSQQIKKSTLKDHEAHTALNITIIEETGISTCSGQPDTQAVRKSHEHATRYVITKGRLQPKLPMEGSPWTTKFHGRRSAPSLCNDGGKACSRNDDRGPTSLPNRTTNSHQHRTGKIGTRIGR
jgi:hypothetical protein